jgi:predicted transcriptional regulator
MPVFTFRLDDEVAQRFDAAADSAGGRSALLRRLVMTAVDAEEGGTPGPVRRREQQRGGLRSG